MNFEDKVQNYHSTFVTSLRDFLNYESEKRQIPPKLFEVMTYSLQNGGKRVRSVLCMAGAELSGANEISLKVLPMAVALELFHISTLINNDMPCIGNNEQRLGKPACHVLHGEALALLACGAIPLWGMKHSIEGLIKNQIPLENIINAVIIFLESAGATGALGGQSLDINSDKIIDMEDIIITTSMKTGDLIKASVKTGAVLAGISGEKLKSIDSYGYYIGTCFQVMDDIFTMADTKSEIIENTEKDKKQEQEQIQKQKIKQDKNTFASMLGLSEARSLAKSCADKAISALNTSFPGKDGEFLRDFALNLLNNRTFL